MAPIRGFIVWGAGTLTILTILFVFVAVGWPAHPDSCTNIHDHVQTVPFIKGTQTPDTKHPDTCYCEAFDVKEVDTGAPGIRQMTNTLSNLYAIITSGYLACRIRRDRAKNTVKNIFYSSESWIPELYVFAVLFLGLGSMFLHASLSASVSWMDGMSMYVFTAFLPLYTLRRRFNLGPCFYTAYVALVAIFTLLNQLPGMEDASTALIGVMIGLYAVAEFVVKGYDIHNLGGIIYKDGVLFGGWIPWFKRLWDGLVHEGWLWRALLFWGLGLGSFLVAVHFRAESQTGFPMCHPDSWFQPHGMLWHILSGVMAVMLYFYWRFLPDAEMRRLKDPPAETWS